jgi:hypothetical protein
MAHREFAKNSREMVRVTPSIYEGHELIDIRVYAKSRETGEITPTRKGVALNVDTIPELIDALVWALGQPCEAKPEKSDEQKMDTSAADKLAETAWKVLAQHGSAVHWDSAEKIVLSSIKGFNKWDLHYVLATRTDLFERTKPGCFRARKRA